MNFLMQSIQTLTITLTEDEAHQFLEDPEPLQDQVREQLDEFHDGENHDGEAETVKRPFGARRV